MKGADQVLALRGVDAGLATDRTVDLRQKRGRHLHEAHTPAQDRGGKAHQVADHAAPQRHDQIAPFDLLVQQPFGHPRQMRPVLGALARRQGQGGDGDPLGLQRGRQRRQVQAGNRGIGHHGHALALQVRRNLGPRAGDQPRSDPHRIGAGPKLDLHHVHAGSSHMSDRACRACSTRAAMPSTDRSEAASTVTSACA